MDMVSASPNQFTRSRATRSVLIIDDSRTNLNIMGHHLGKLGYLVLLADSGAQALELIASRRFDLVLLDKVMPQMSGMDVLREIRGSRDLQDLPVIMFTAHADQSGAMQAYAAGADDYFVQPVDFEQMGTRIARVLARAERTEELKRLCLTLDARIAARAIELGEARRDLAQLRGEISSAVAL